MYQKEFDATFYILQLAAKKILSGYFSTVTISYKIDQSVVTNIDKEVDQMIRDYLSSIFPNYGFLTEESKDDLSRIDKEFVWIIDPIDGTLEFVNHKYEFVTNVALCKNHEIVFSMILAPLTNEYFYAIKGEGAFRIFNNKVSRIHVNDKTNNLTCLTSPYHQGEEEKIYLDKHQDKFKEIKYKGAAYKACLIAKGEAEVSYRFSPNSKEWDTAAIDLLIKEAGGIFFDKNKKEFTYNKKDIRNLDGFIMLNKIENYF